MFRIGGSPDSEKEDDQELTMFGGFDADDPDFMSPSETPPLPPRPRSRMSGSRNSSSSSLRRIASNNSMGKQLSDNLRQFSFETLEENDSSEGDYLSFQVKQPSLNTLTRVDTSTQCQSCGVLWHMEQFSLDCQECGGSALTKACPKCSGVCGQTWRRDLVSCHVLSRASWIGQCLINEAENGSDQEEQEEQICENPDTKKNLEKVIERLQDL